jgi:hypothetical protein
MGARRQRARRVVASPSGSDVKGGNLTSSQNCRKFLSDSSDGLPASRAALMAPIEMPAVQPGEDPPRPGLPTASLIGAERAAVLPQQGDAFKGRTAARPTMFQPSQSAILSRTSSRLSTPVNVPVNQLAQRSAVGYSAHRLTSIRFGPNAVALQRASPHAVEIRPTDLAERQKRIGIGALGQCLFRELPELDTRPQCNLHNGSEHRLRSTHNIIRGK